MSDHRVDIWDSFESYTSELRSIVESGDDDRHWSDEVLEVVVWRRVDPDYGTDAIVEFLLAFGGPTVRVTVHPRDGVSFFHSWGCDYRKRVPASDGGLTYPDLTTIEPYGSDADFWVSLADEASEVFS